MADITITAANVMKGAGANPKNGTAGATLTAGVPVYKDTDGKHKPCDASAEATAVCDGIMLNCADADQPVQFVSEGEIDLGATLVIGEVYCVSPVAGGIAPYADLLSGDFVTPIGVAKTTALLKLGIQVSGVAIP